MTTRELQRAIESLADPALQEDWDNTGWNINLHNDIRAVMVCLDCTQAVVAQAAEKGCGAIISHHPLLFHPLRKIDSAKMPGRVIADLMRHQISLYCAHTSCDSAAGGINTWLGRTLGLENTQPLRPCAAKMYKMSVTVPAAAADAVRSAMTDAGAGAFGLYDNCTFSSAGRGTFRPLPGANPALGTPGQTEEVAEIRIEALVGVSRLAAVQKAVRLAHPYEVPAVDVWELEDVRGRREGLGIAGSLSSPVTLAQFLQRVREKLDCGMLRFSGDPAAKIVRVGICGGGGHDLIADAVKAGCDVFLTGELRHNSYLDYDIALVEAGHYDTEKCFVQIMADTLRMSEPVIQYKVAVHGFAGRERPYIDC